MKPEQTISIHGSHDASITFIDKNNKLRIYEYERFIKKRYAMFSFAFDNKLSQPVYVKSISIQGLH